MRERERWLKEERRTRFDQNTKHKPSSFYLSAAVIDLRRADVTISSDCVDVDLPPGVAVPAVGGDAGVRVVFDF